MRHTPNFIQTERHVANYEVFNINFQYRDRRPFWILLLPKVHYLLT